MKGNDFFFIATLDLCMMKNIITLNAHDQIIIISKITLG